MRRPTLLRQLLCQLLQLSCVATAAAQSTTYSYSVQACGAKSTCERCEEVFNLKAEFTVATNTNVVLLTLSESNGHSTATSLSPCTVADAANWICGGKLEPAESRTSPTYFMSRGKLGYESNLRSAGSVRLCYYSSGWLGKRLVLDAPGP